MSPDQFNTHRPPLHGAEFSKASAGLEHAAGRLALAAPGTIA
jgi:hypothetical protein